MKAQIQNLKTLRQNLIDRASELDTIIKQLEAKNLSIDIIQGDARRWRINLPNVSNDATRILTGPPEYSVNVSPVDYIRGLGFESAEPDTAMGSNTVAVYANEKPAPLEFTFRNHDSANTDDPYGPEYTETVAWEEA